MSSWLRLSRDFCGLVVATRCDKADPSPNHAPRFWLRLRFVRRLPVYCGERHCVLQSDGVRTLVLRIPDDLEAQVQALASRHDKTKSAIARELLSKGVRTRRKGELAVFDLI